MAWYPYVVSVVILFVDKNINNTKNRNAGDGKQQLSIRIYSEKKIS